jgi:hypothetical protein
MRIGAAARTLSLRCTPLGLHCPASTRAQCVSVGARTPSLRSTEDPRRHADWSRRADPLAPLELSRPASTRADRKKWNLAVTLMGYHGFSSASTSDNVTARTFFAISNECCPA